jgi:acetyltransferase-like isoleucine patch superfamily enzyme
LFDCHLENVTVGDNVEIHKNAWIMTLPNGEQPAPRIDIGDNVYIGRNLVMSAAAEILVGKNTMISYDVSILDHNHAYKDRNVPPQFQGIDGVKKVVIGEDCFIGAQSFILSGVELGQHCFVGANSVVTKSFPPYSVIAGSPAKLIRSID